MKTRPHGRENMVFSKGFIYRFGQRIKDLGEWLGHVKIFGLRIFCWCCGAVTGAGLWIMDSVGNCPAAEL